MRMAPYLAAWLSPIFNSNYESFFLDSLVVFFYIRGWKRTAGPLFRSRILGDSRAEIYFDLLKIFNIGEAL